MLKRDWPAWAKPSDIIDLLRLSVPIAISRSSFMLMVMTDTIVLGRNAPGELPYIMNAWLPIGILIGVASGLLLGVSVLTAEMSGRGEAENTGRIFRRGLILALGFSVVAGIIVVSVADPLYRLLGFEGELHAGTTEVTRILCLAVIAQLVCNAMASYLEALRKPLLVSVSMYIGVGVNLVLDLLLVSGELGFPSLGATGVAMATTGTNWCLIFVFLIFIALRTPGFKKSGPAPANEVKRQISVGSGMAISNAVEFGAFNFTHIIATWVSIAAAAAYGMTFQMIGFIFMSFLGIGTATSVRVAERYGRRDEAGTVNASRLGLISCICVGLLAAAGMMLLSDPLAAIFVHSEAVIDGVILRPLLSSLIALAGFVVVFDGLQNVAAMASRARGLVWVPAIIHVGSYLLLMLPLAYLLGVQMGHGAWGMVEAVIVASVVAGFAQVLVLEKFARKGLPNENG